MAEEVSAKHPSDRRAEPRHQLHRFHSVEMKLASLPIYLFKLVDVSANGACFIVKEGSDILKHLNVGQMLNMRYHAKDETERSEEFKSEIKHITKALKKPYKGHYLVGIILREKQI
jgi:hypothetical protein